MTARHVALEVLLACRRHDGFVQEILNKHLAESSLTGPDRGLASQLAYGVLRRRATLDALLTPFIQRPLGRGKEAIHETLRLGAFQLAFLSRIPAHAAVHATVELVGAGMRGFVNGVLRNVDRLLTPGTVTEPAADALPLDTGRYRRLAKAVLPSPGQYPVEYLSAGFALPSWLLTRWLARLGWEECLRMGFWFAGTPPLWLRCNTLRTDRAALLDAFRAAGIEADAGEHPQAIRLAEHALVRELPGYAEGWFAVQDESAMRVASALAPKLGDTVLDLCAAPGGKTTHLAELMNNQGRIVACDVDESRLQTLRELANRLGVSIIETQRLEAGENALLPEGPFDAVLVDAPCSNTGVLGRRPEARWRLHENDLTELAKLQARLLRQAVNRLKPGGKLVYSTCSIEPEENREIVRTVLQDMPWMMLQGEEGRSPGGPTDGGYWARLLRRQDNL